MNCHDFGRLQDACVDGELEPAESAALQEHLRTCAPCSRRLADRDSLGRLVRRASYYPAPDRLRATVLGTRKRSWFAPRLLAWAATVALAASLGGAMVVRTVRSPMAADMTARFRATNDREVEPGSPGI